MNVLRDTCSVIRVAWDVNIGYHRVNRYWFFYVLFIIFHETCPTQHVSRSIFFYIPEQFLNDIFGCYSFSVGMKVRNNSMTQHGNC